MGGSPAAVAIWEDIAGPTRSTEHCRVRSLLAKVQVMLRVVTPAEWVTDCKYSAAAREVKRATSLRLINSVFYEDMHGLIYQV